MNSRPVWDSALLGASAERGERKQGGRQLKWRKHVRERERHGGKMKGGNGEYRV